ncbi:recombination associated protein RdgC [Modicisalibacter xianhensis]|uniref:Recombination-associated protein RdgC n=1 Tax=Modicisalibacter xianhensis TaxID=442341 RepID=A0A4R8FUF7_9GAMM|nr:recombination-associated protein RdgC [Halomonas xianhensis]TDX29147.1 recombination associated protein RdgC [Halomonas xianhensis]
MWFKTLHLYRVHDAVALALPVLNEALQEQAFRPLGSVEAKRMGWIAPTGRGSEVFAHEVSGQRLLSAQRQERLLPASVVKEEVESRAAEREEAEGRPLRKQEKQALKEQVYEELLPRAFVRSWRFDLWWDSSRNLIAVNATSRKRAEDVLDLLRQTLGSLKVTPLATRTTPTRAMTEWLNDPVKRPAWLALGNQVEIKAVSGDESVVRGMQLDLDGEEVHVCLDAGRQVTRLAMTIDEQVSLTLGDDLALKGLRFADALLDEASQTDDGDDPVLRLETDFALMTGALSGAISCLVEGLGGEATPATPAP